MAIITIVGSGMMGSALAFPARENGHEEQEISLAYIIVQHFHGNVRIDHDAGFHPEGVDPVYVLAGILPGGFIVERAHPDAVGSNPFEPALRFDNHQVGVHRDRDHLRKLVENRETERNVRHETAVHHVEMEYIRRIVDHPEVILQMEEISGEE